MSIFVKKVKPEDVLNEALHVTLVGCSKYIERELPSDSPLRVLAKEALSKIQGSVIKYEDNDVKLLQAMIGNVINPALAKGYNPPIMLLNIISYLLQDVQYEPTALVFNKYKQFIKEVMNSVKESNTDVFISTITTLVDLINSQNGNKPHELSYWLAEAKHITKKREEYIKTYCYGVYLNDIVNENKYNKEEADIVVGNMIKECDPFDYIVIHNRLNDHRDFVHGTNYIVKKNGIHMDRYPKAIWPEALALFCREIEYSKDIESPTELSIVNVNSELEIRYWSNPAFEKVEVPRYMVFNKDNEMLTEPITKHAAFKMFIDLKASNNSNDYEYGLAASMLETIPSDNETKKELELFDLRDKGETLLTDGPVVYDTAKILFDRLVKKNNDELDATQGNVNKSVNLEIVNVKTGEVKDFYILAGEDRPVETEVCSYNVYINSELYKANVTEDLGIKILDTKKLEIENDSRAYGEFRIELMLGKETVRNIVVIKNKPVKIEPSMTVDVEIPVKKTYDKRESKPDRNDTVRYIVMINAKCDIIEFFSNNEMLSNIGKYVKQTSDISVLDTSHGLYNKLKNEEREDKKYDLILIEKGGYARIETMTKLKVTAKDMSSSYLKYILDI